MGGGISRNPAQDFPQKTGIFGPQAPHLTRRNPKKIAAPTGILLPVTGPALSLEELSPSLSLFLTLFENSFSNKIYAFLCHKEQQ